jgi:hypothetical protein
MTATEAAFEAVLPDETPSLVAGVPPHLISGLREYALHGEPVGLFLTAVLSNNLAVAVGRADDESLAELRGIVSYVYNAMPSRCWGSPERVKAWMAEHWRGE